MNGPGDIPLTLSSTPETKPCSLISIIPTLGMSSCRGRAEAFARRLSSKLRTLGSQGDEDALTQEDEPIINGSPTNTWLPPHESEQTVTALQPLRHESDSFFDFDCELESPGSPVDECEYLRLIETASNTPHNSAAESGYVCASAASSHSSADGAYFDAINSEGSVAMRKKISPTELHDYVDSLQINGSKERICNGFDEEHTDDNSSQACESEAPGEDQLEHHAAEIMEPLSPIGPDGADVAKLVESPIHELTTEEMIRMQNEIISELEKQSSELTAEIAEDKCHNDAAGLETTEAIVTTVITTITTLATDTVVLTNTSEAVNTAEMWNVEKTDDSESELNCTNEAPHKHSNGRPENGEDEHLLQIALTEFNNKLREVESTVTTSPEHHDVHSNEPNKADTSPDIEPIERPRLSTLDTTDDEDDCRPQRVRRCSSLKTGKTPPGTPGRKKIVRFADVLGLDLADVKTFLDEIPTIPKSAFEDLEIMESEPPVQLGPKSDKLLMPLFQQPGGLTTFLDMVREKQVSLENAAVTDSVNQTITGSVRVRNLDFHKSVHVRYSLDGWRSFADLQANYVKNSCDGFSDKFTFILFGNSLHIGQRLEFAVRFQCRGQQFWDNNYGANYCFQCLPTSNQATHPIQPITTSHHSNHHMVGLLSPSVGEAWCTSFY